MCAPTPPTTQLPRRVGGGAPGSRWEMTVVALDTDRVPARPGGGVWVCVGGSGREDWG